MNRRWRRSSLWMHHSTDHCTKLSNFCFRTFPRELTTNSASPRLYHVLYNSKSLLIPMNNFRIHGGGEGLDLVQLITRELTLLSPPARALRLLPSFDASSSLQQNSRDFS